MTVAGGCVGRKAENVVETGLRAQQNELNPCCQVMAAQVMRHNANASLREGFPDTQYIQQAGHQHTV